MAVIAVVALSMLALSRMLDDVVYDDLVAAIEDTSWLDIGLAVLFTATQLRRAVDLRPAGACSGWAARRRSAMSR